MKCNESPDIHCAALECVSRIVYVIVFATAHAQNVVLWTFGSSTGKKFASSDPKRISCSLKESIYLVSNA